MLGAMPLSSGGTGACLKLTRNNVPQLANAATNACDAIRRTACQYLPDTSASQVGSAPRLPRVDRPNNTFASSILHQDSFSRFIFKAAKSAVDAAGPA
jgi:hypothetical protein